MSFLVSAADKGPRCRPASRRSALPGSANGYREVKMSRLRPGRAAQPASRAASSGSRTCQPPSSACRLSSKLSSSTTMGSTGRISSASRRHRSAHSTFAARRSRPAWARPSPPSAGDAARCSRAPTSLSTSSTDSCPALETTKPASSPRDRSTSAARVDLPTPPMPCSTRPAFCPPRARRASRVSRRRPTNSPTSRTTTPSASTRGCGRCTSPNGSRRLNSGSRSPRAVSVGVAHSAGPRSGEPAGRACLSRSAARRTSAKASSGSGVASVARRR